MNTKLLPVVMLAPSVGVSERVKKKQLWSTLVTSQVEERCISADRLHKGCREKTSQEVYWKQVDYLSLFVQLNVNWKCLIIVILIIPLFPEYGWILNSRLAETSLA